MEFKVFRNNPIIETQGEFYELRDRLLMLNLKTDKWDTVTIRTNSIRIEIDSIRRTFNFPKSCGIEWIISKIMTVYDMAKSTNN